MENKQEQVALLEEVYKVLRWHFCVRQDVLYMKKLKELIDKLRNTV